MFANQVISYRENAHLFPGLALRQDIASLCLTRWFILNVPSINMQSCYTIKAMLTSVLAHHRKPKTNTLFKHGSSAIRFSKLRCGCIISLRDPIWNIIGISHLIYKQRLKIRTDFVGSDKLKTFAARPLLSMRIDRHLSCSVMQL